MTWGIVAAFIAGIALAVGIISLRRARDYHHQLEMARQELKVSEASYRYLFENAHDAIWLHDLEGNFLTGFYSVLTYF